MDTYFDEIVIKVTHSSLAKVKDAQIVANTAKALLCKFEFKTEEWAEMARTAVFVKKHGRCCTVKEDPVHVLLGDDNVCEIPAEVLEDGGEFKVGIFGIKDEEVLPTNFLVFKIKEGCFSTGTEPAPPTPTIYQQLLNSLEKKQDKLEAGAGITIEDRIISTTSANSVIVPTIGVKVDPDASNALTVGAAGLKVEIPAAAEYSIVKDQTSTYAATYHLTKGGVNTGVAIDIPKDMVVKSGEVVTNPAGQTAGTYLVLTLANATEDKVYINVGSLIEYVTSGSKDGDQIKINVSSDHKVTATLSNGSVTKAQLVTEVQTSLDKADSALQKASITTGTTNGTIGVSGEDIKVNGLGSAAYTNADAYDEKGAASAVLGTAADGANVATVYGVKAAIVATNTEIAKKINATEVSAIGKSGNVKDLLQTEGDVLVFNCGTASTVI